MEACASRFYVNISHNLFRKIYIRPSRSLCSKVDKSQPLDVSVSESDVKVNQKLPDNHVPPSKDESASNMRRCDESGSSNKDASLENENKKSQAKLLSVLSDLKVNTKSRGSTFNFDLARPSQRLRREKNTVEFELKKSKSVGYDKGMASAVKAVAASLGGDVEKTEQELVQSLISISNDQQVEKPEVAAEERTESEDAKDESQVSEDIMSSVRVVASSIVGDPEKVESELTKKLVSLADGTTESFDMSDVVEGMKVEKRKLEQSVRKPPVRQTRMSRKMIEHQIDLFNGTPLNIFKLENKEASEESVRLLLWDQLQKKELQSLVQYAPSNPYEEMIQWTEQGKLWTFPINNEAGMHEEENVGFHEHIFLDHLLKGFPENRSIHLFMELVITGLSKNPYMSVQRKAEHVAWYREYFENHEQILKQY